MTKVNPKTLCLIPARGGSKGIPGKNVRTCLGKPLIDFTIDTALDCCDPQDVVVSSDDEQVLERAIARGVIALRRPDFLAQDDTPMIAVIQHALMVTNYFYSHLLLLQPTAPYRSVNEIHTALARLALEEADLIASVSAIPKEISPHLMVKIDNGLMVPVLPGIVPSRRQDAAPVYLRNGQFYGMKTKHIAYGGGLYDGKVLAFETEDCGINLDTESDWAAFVARQAANYAS
jgi:CMP-N,N'-diacetyllegionaminic acid synthase